MTPFARKKITLYENKEVEGKIVPVPVERYPEEWIPLLIAEQNSTLQRIEHLIGQFVNATLQGHQPPQNNHKK